MVSLNVFFSISTGVDWDQVFSLDADFTAQDVGKEGKEVQVPGCLRGVLMGYPLVN